VKRLSLTFDICACQLLRTTGQKGATIPEIGLLWLFLWFGMDKVELRYYILKSLLSKTAFELSEPLAWLKQKPSYN
jgi:hypothetical protein